MILTGLKLYIGYVIGSALIGLMVIVCGVGLLYLLGALARSNNRKIK